MVNGSFHSPSKEQKHTISLTNNPTAGIIFLKALAWVQAQDIVFSVNVLVD